MKKYTLIMLSLLLFSVTSAFATTLPANITNFAVVPIGSSGEVTGINSNNGVLNFLEIQIPAQSIFTLYLTASNGGTIPYIDIFGNTGAFVPTGSGYSYSYTTSASGSGGPYSPIQNVGAAQIFDSNLSYVGTISPGYLQSSTSIAPDLSSAVATYINNQEVGSAVLEADFFGINPQTGLLSATFTVASAAPVPEPSTMGLVGLGIAGLAVFGKKRSAKL